MTSVRPEEAWHVVRIEARRPTRGAERRPTASALRSARRRQGGHHAIGFRKTRRRGSLGSPGLMLIGVLSYTSPAQASVCGEVKLAAASGVIGPVQRYTFSAHCTVTR